MFCLLHLVAAVTGTNVHILCTVFTDKLRAGVLQRLHSADDVVVNWLKEQQ